MKTLITGAKGFTASYLIKLLVKASDTEIYLTDIIDDNSGNYYKCDLNDEEAALDLIDKIRPNRIYNLAGAYSHDYDTDYKANVTVPENILESLLDLNIRPRVMLIGSAAEYGDIKDEENPVPENHDLKGDSYYGLTKVFQSEFLNDYTSYGLDIVMARTFNLYGEGISDKLLPGNLYKQISEYKDGIIKKIKLGNLDAKRDYLHINEAVKYYKLIMDKGLPGYIYNVGSGKSIVLRDFVSMILKENGLDLSVVDESGKKSGVADIYADISKLHSLLS